MTSDIFRHIVLALALSGIPLHAQDWPQHQRDPWHSGYSPVEVPRRGDDLYTLYKGFWDLSPEVGRFLADHAGFLGDHAGAAVERVRQTMEWQIPLWYANQSPVPSEWWQNIPARAEDTFNPPRIAGPLFLVRACVTGEDAATLQGYLDIPYCLGDPDYLQQCVALLRAVGAAGWVRLAE